MRIIPVIDIMGGVVVHAEGGRREKYRPLKSLICKTSVLMDVVLALKSNFNFDEFYIADLDSIMGYGQNIKILREISELRSIKIMIDSGINDILKAEELLQVGVSKIIIGTETLTSLEFLETILEFAGHEHVVVSIDTKRGRILSKCKGIIGLRPEFLAKKLESMGIRELIVLDLSKIGSGSGVDIELARRVVNSVKIPITIGGGIRDIDDILLLQKFSISGVLVSTALHTLKITKKDFLRLQASV
ncbi:MAG: HisA/HisF-related TIM barrel protein [Candidatus Methylarchaceae archaeon HK02M1]|nr:HisA/HisF-related TIM barrel protein [Candidatus Methylarchaceae archaeon HK01M]MCP8312676.1 HisA/HisF-related TIM barrel protein [Candidatus Methylarchaceae archaeon HK02M1]